VISDSGDTETELAAIRSVAQSEPIIPHIIKVDDFWFENNEDRGIFNTYIKMEICHGTLADYLDARKQQNIDIEPWEIAEIMIQILNGLAYCHNRGVCHRDLKPSNSRIPISKNG
jgi:serine/threonine protein kinase